ncbi:MAG: DUF4145 domain-containing protein [Nanoarchaeota archaeon]|nr:DUF4145 domain-containing protein [Nanoarchaeota archaeon]
MTDFQKNLINLSNALDTAVKNNVDLTTKIDSAKAIYDFKVKKQLYHVQAVQTALKLVKSASIELPQLNKYDSRNSERVSEILVMMPELESNDVSKLKSVVQKIKFLSDQINYPKDDIENIFPIPSYIPEDVKSEVKADISELNKCFNAGCLRSAIILCGRLLETALHRKYFETTGNDLLEKSPGIGLGNIIAKLKDQGVLIDPALTNQVHLINQIRIFSVHKKKEAFYPSKDQTHAIVLYSLDAMEKLFK